MTTISEMYRRSGGCDREHICSECLAYVPSEKVKRSHTCKLHPERPPFWQSGWMACRLFRNEPLMEAPPVYKQMDIFDMEGAIP